MSENPFTQIPDVITTLISLKKLDMANCLLKRLPESLGQMQEITELLLEGNFLTDLPLSINKLQHLERLNIHNNQFTALPASLADLQHLDLISYHTNPIAYPPPEICPIIGNMDMAADGGPYQDFAPIRQFFRTEHLHMLERILAKIPTGKPLTAAKAAFPDLLRNARILEAKCTAHPDSPTAKMVLERLAAQRHVLLGKGIGKKQKILL